MLDVVDGSDETSDKSEIVDNDEANDFALCSWPEARIGVSSLSVDSANLHPCQREQVLGITIKGA